MPEDVEDAGHQPQRGDLTRWQRFGLCSCGLILCGIATANEWWRHLDGVGTLGFLIAGAVFVGVGLLGKYPSKIRWGDKEVAWEQTVADQERADNLETQVAIMPVGRAEKVVEVAQHDPSPIVREKANSLSKAILIQKLIYRQLKENSNVRFRDPKRITGACLLAEKEELQLYVWVDLNARADDIAVIVETLPPGATGLIITDLANAFALNQVSEILAGCLQRSSERRRIIITDSSSDHIHYTLEFIVSRQWENYHAGDESFWMETF